VFNFNLNFSSYSKRNCFLSTSWAPVQTFKVHIHYCHILCTTAIEVRNGAK